MKRIFCLLLVGVGVVGASRVANAAASVNTTNIVPNLKVLTNATMPSLTVTTTNWTLPMPSTGVLGGTAGGGVGVTGTTGSGLVVKQTGPEINGLITSGASVAIPPTTATQSGTNFVANFAAGGWQLVTCTNDLYVTMSNPSAGLSVLIEFAAGDTNRNITFDTNFVWFSAKPTVISSNHFMWVNLVAATNSAAGIRATACQSVP